MTKIWNKAIMLVCRNELRTRLNKLSVMCVANEINEQPIICVAKDTVYGEPLSTHKLNLYIPTLPDNKTEDLPRFLPLLRGLLKFVLLDTYIKLKLE
jgi:hypothetical protein